MVTVGVVAGEVEKQLVAGRLRCPGCGGRLAGWGHGRERVIRGEGGIGWLLCPRRSRCGSCGRTHVLLPVSCLLRRADGVVVIWAALAAKAAGLGHRPIARQLGLSASTVRDWLARFGARAEQVRRLFAVSLRAPDPDRLPPGKAGSVLAGAVAAVEAAAGAVRWRWRARAGAESAGELAGGVSAGRLLAPGWPPERISTSSF